MGTRWRRAFCTSIPREQSEAAVERPESPGLRSCTRLGFFSSSSSAISGGGGGGGSCASSAPTTPRAQAEVVTPSSSLRCRTKWTPAAAAAQERSSVQQQGKANDSAAALSPRPSPRAPVAQAAAAGSNPASPRSPSRFALLKLRLSRTSCGVCLQSVKTGQGTAIFTAECSHAFHFPCIAAHVRKQGALACPVCATTWRQVPLLSNHIHMASDEPDGADAHTDCKQGGARSRVAELLQRRKAEVAAARGESSPRTAANVAAAAEKFYNDDEPLLPPGGAFNPIAEGEEEEEEEEQSSDYEFQGFFPSQQKQQQILGSVQVVLAPDALLLSAGRTHDKYVVVLKVKAPPPLTPSHNTTGSAGGVPLLDPSRRAPIDLVTVLDVGGSMTGAKLHMLKRAMRLVISSLIPADRLAIVGSAAAAKRLLPLRRMTPQGQRSARRIVDRLVCGHGNCVGDALRKATRVLEDRRERNPVASIMLLSDGHQQQQQQHLPPQPLPQAPQQKPVLYRRLSSFPQHRPTSTASGTRFAHLEIPVQGSNDKAPPVEEDAFAKCVGGLLSVVVQDARLHLAFSSGDITAVYNSSGQPAALGVGGGSIRLGDLYAEEERELLVELRVPIGTGTHRNVSSLKAKCTYRDPATQHPVICAEQAMAVSLPQPPSAAAVDINPKVERLRNLYVTTRAIVEARRLTDLNDFATALHLLSSAQSLLLQSTCSSAKESLALLESEVAEVQGRREQRRRMGPREPLTPAAAWRGAVVGVPEGDEGGGGAADADVGVACGGEAGEGGYHAQDHEPGQRPPRVRERPVLVGAKVGRTGQLVG